MTEQLLFRAAAGMAVAEIGLMPFASNYSVFTTLRTHDWVSTWRSRNRAEREHRRGG